MSRNEMEKYKVIIIGSGIAGLAAASKLIKKGLEDILVIEAQDYIGGRINTIEFNGCPIELGAQWIHGSSSNPIYDLCDHLGLVEDEQSENGKMLCCTQTSMEISENYLNKMNENFDRASEKVSRNIANLIKDMPLGELLDKECNKYIKLQEDQYLAQSVYEAYLKEERISCACEHLHSLSSVGWNNFQDLKGNAQISLNEDWRRVVEHLVGIIGSDRIRLSEPVTNIDYHSKEIIISTKKSTYKTDYCLCTMSLGYLKTNHRKIFQPALPRYKIEAIERLGFGVVNKFFFIFEGPVFYDGEQGMQIFWLNQLNVELDSAKKWNVKNEFYKTFSTFEVLKYQPNVLYSFLYGRDAVYSENLENSCIMQIVYELLTKCFTQIKLPRMRFLVRSKWSSNPYVSGSYAHIRLGAKLSDVKALSLPINNNLFFAGEATSLKHMSTVHGAYSSGMREANNIYDRLNRRDIENSKKNSIACSIV